MIQGMNIEIDTADFFLNLPSSFPLWGWTGYGASLHLMIVYSPPRFLLTTWNLNDRRKLLSLFLWTSLIEWHEQFFGDGCTGIQSLTR